MVTFLKLFKLILPEHDWQDISMSEVDGNSSTFVDEDPNNLDLPTAEALFHVQATPLMFVIFTHINCTCDTLSYSITPFYYFGLFRFKCMVIYMKGCKKSISNYRPISVLPVISKIFETVMHEQLTEHFVNNFLFNPQQYGFRKNSSTELAALELIHRLLNQLNNHSIPINFYIDLSKAFDSLRHDILIEKLAYYGVKNKALDLLKSYLSNRKQYVKLNDITSTVRSISVGVPQGSIIGPLLFNIFINDIVKASTKFSFILYADDTTLHSTLDSFGQNVIEIQEAIVAELQKVFKWLKLNRLSLNVAKSKFMLFHMPQKIVPELSFTINDMVIDHVKEFTFLCLI